jgi:hypothetical protein
MELGVTWLRIYAEKRNELFQRFADKKKADSIKDLREQPVYEIPVDWDWSCVPHLDDFFENVKGRGQCKAPVSEGFKAMVGVAMAIQSYKTGKSVKWDQQTETLLT